MGGILDKLKQPEAWDKRDKISNLPDVLLTHILSFIPTKYAVRTSVLSTRWKSLWAYVPALDIRDSEFLPKGDALMDCNKRKANFFTFVHCFLIRNDWSSIRKFCVICSEKYEFSQIESWICALKHQNVEELQLTVYSFLEPTSDLPLQNSYFSLSYSCLDPHLRSKTSLPTREFKIQGSYLEDPCILDSLFSLPKEWNVKDLEFVSCSEGFDSHETYNFPQRLFRCETLVVLKLRQCMDLDCPEDAICFPNLKVLHLEENTFKHRDSASNLINSSCPVLEELDIARGDFDDLQRLVITSHTLKRLTLHFASCECFDDLNLPFETLIDVPALEYFNLRDWVATKYVLGDIGSVTEATVDVYSDCAAKLLRKIHNVKKLSLYEEVWTLMESFDLPAYDHLTCLEFYSDDINAIEWTLVLEFLHLSPMLEDLVFQGVKFVVSEEFDLTSEQNVPHCLLSSLKTCGFGWLHGDKNEVEVIGYFLKNSKVLNHMSISSFKPENVNKQAISALPMGSSACEICYKGTRLPQESSSNCLTQAGSLARELLQHLCY